MIDITQIVEALIGLLGIIIVTVLVPYIRTKTTESQQAKLQELINIAVYAAEQLSKEPDNGAQKKNYVLGFLQDRGVTYDASAVDTMIEAAVKKLNIEQK